MLKVYFGTLNDALSSGNGYFDNWIDEDCIETDFGKKIIKEIDGGDVYDKNLIVSKVLGGIPPERLSGGTKALFVLMFSNKVVKLSAMGDNCLPYLYDISLVKNITVCTDSYRPIFDNSGLSDVYVINSNKIVHSKSEFFNEFVDWRITDGR